MKIDAKTLNDHDSYRLLTGSILPRPIAWVTSVNPESGVVNLAPFSFFTGVSVLPPLVLFASERRNGEKKDTVRNIEATGEFGLNLVTADLAEQMVLSAADFPPDVSEVTEAGLELMAGDKISAPLVAASPVKMECKLERIIEIGTSPHSLVIGEVVQWHIRDDLYDNGRIDMNRLNALGRLAGNNYVRTNDIFSVQRLDQRKDSY